MTDAPDQQHYNYNMKWACAHKESTRLVVGAALLADLQRGVVGRAGERIPGVGAVHAPQHKQIVARCPEQQVRALGALQRLLRWRVARGLCHPTPMAPVFPLHATSLPLQQSYVE